MRVSIQQAAANAFASWLGEQLPDVIVESRWPNPSKLKGSKVISVIPAGRRIDLPIDLRQFKKTIDSESGHKITTKWQVAECTQPFQLDIWADYEVDRDDIIARLDDPLRAGALGLPEAYNPDPIDNGVLIELTKDDGWEDSIADFVFAEPDLEDTPVTEQRTIYRATYRGNAYMKLMVTTVTARMKTVDIKLLLDGEEL